MLTNQARAYDTQSYYRTKGQMLMNEDANENPMAGNQHATKHGAEGAIRRISENKPFLGLAADTEKTVTDEMENAGVDALIKRDAIRMQTVSDLYYSAVLKAAQDGDIDALDRYVARYGWMQSATLRALALVAASEKHDDHKDAVDLIAKYRKGAADANDS